MTTFGYIRVSRRTQDPENQKLEILRFANNQGITIPDENWIEVTISGGAARASRRIQELVDKIEPGDQLIATELSRLGRSGIEVQLLVNELLTKGVRLRLIKEGWDIDPARKGLDLFTELMVAIFAAFAQMERRLISLRTREALASKKQAGVKLGRRVGFQKSKLDPHREEIISKLQSGVPASRVAKDYNISRTSLYFWINSRNLSDLCAASPPEAPKQIGE
ncbi:recombinase family protein [Oryzomonas rubra]|uniref:Resolvase n=1 Tax=Oryzomonas rubra TaxID=2509454 RepID=A0A5A9X4Z8_9BACT|nr:recombinase family protein [Oryzomonas rubra]KAA0888066.1 resolvase [Oryzomonas rubra]